ncbi:CPBP family intramembrane glutamic endopeptidase [[Limnothrix rosea] IAM M-220]|uniref:CPBP family intramembrane glutamic endopeptidase n=1 Tax=[Limnothrix rosea] IAM M-220 TaxID=454133 RepID=UPI00095D32FD|nr:type II CAAX endopeptidase family protein [[Limnothrix rosea] IAM M-220]OKH19792.1 CAAX protease family protein [[Limnothrix rosea] IAM M-220]
MNIRPSNADQQYQIPFVSLVPFLLMTFGLTWGLFALFIFFSEPITEIFGAVSGQHPLFILAVWAPAIATFILVTFHSGREGLQRYLSRLFLWRCSPSWYLFLIFGVPLLFFGGSALKGDLFATALPFDSFQSLILALVMTIITGPVEEFGWRGLALPLLQRKFAPIGAALILGIIWGFWHLPAFLLSGTPQSAWSFTPFLAGSIALSVIVTPLFNTSRGSILLPAIFHFQCNNPIWPDAQPYDIFIFIVAAIVIVWLKRKTMFRKTRAVTTVIPISTS